MSGTRIDTRPRNATLLLCGLAVMTLYSYLRGASDVWQPAGAIYFVVDYTDGFVRRGLIGQLFMLFYTRAQAASVWQTAMLMHRVASFAVLFAMLVWLWSVVWTQRRFAADRMVFLYMLFVGSAFYPTLAVLTSYLDSYVFLLILLAFALVANGRPGLATCLGAIGPLVHELSVVMWAPLVLMVVWRDGTSALLRPRILLLCAAPFLVAAIALDFESARAVAMQMQRAPLPEGWRAAMAQWQFGNTVHGDLAMMLHKLVGNPWRFACTLLAFVIPTLAMIAVAAPALAPRGRLLFAAASLSPLGTLVLAWDLSRFVVATQFAAMLAVLFMATTAKVPVVPNAPISPNGRRGLGLFIALLLLSPLVYGYFDRTTLTGNAVLEMLPVIGPRLHALDTVTKDK